MVEIGERRRQHFVTAMVDAERGQLLDVVPDRKGEAPTTWLRERRGVPSLFDVCSPRIRRPKREYSATARPVPSVLAVVRVRSLLGAK